MIMRYRGRASSRRTRATFRRTRASSRRVLAASVVTFFVLGPAGCGIPDHTDVQVDGRGPAPSDSAPRTGAGREPPRREESGDDVERFVLNFLQAAAGEAAGAYDRVNKYIPPGNNQLRPRQGNEVAINVVRLTEETPRVTVNPDGTNSVVVAVQQVGVLRANGTISEAVASETQYTFTVGRAESPADGEPEPGRGLYVLDPPQTLLMSTHALRDYYRTRSIYFWNSDRSALVPDLRYLPVTVPNGRQATEVLSWLTGGPSPWLAGAVVPLPGGTKAIGNVPAAGPDGRMVVNLSIQAGEVNNAIELNRLYTQLAWSLRDIIQNELELKIEHQSRKVASAAEHRDGYSLYRLFGAPERFCVYAEQVRPLVGQVGPARPGGPGGPGGPGQSGQVPLAPAVNRNVLSASFARDAGRVWAALVTGSPNDRQLLVGTGPGTVSNLDPVGDRHTSMGRPIWLKGSDPDIPLGLVLAGGRLHRFGLDRRLVPVSVPNVPGTFSTVAAALDGHRIAFISGGVLYVAAVAIDGASLTVSPARRVATSLKNLTAVDWGGENTLVTAGQKADGRVAIYQVGVDSGLESAVVNQVTAETVPHLATYPDNPMEPAPAGTPLYEGNGVAYAAGERIGPDQVGALDQGGAPPGSGNPTVPFFLY